MARITFSCFFLLAELSVTLALVVTPGDLAVLEGRSVTIPCHYDPQYLNHNKYFCQGRMRDFCSTLARSHDTAATESEGEGEASKVSIFDDPTQLVFTVTMTELTEKDSGYYWCGVEVGGMWHADDASSLYIDVVHGMSVLNSMVHGEEGDSITVECQYSARHSESDKKWCRSGDWGSCVKTDSNGTFRNAAVEIHDNRREAFTVTLLNVQRRDTGWYWCASGEQQVAVRVMVSPRATTLTPTTTTADPTTVVTTETSLPPGSPPVSGLVIQSSGNWLQSLMIGLYLLLVIVVIVVAFKFWKHYRRTKAAKQHEEMESSLAVCPVREDDWKNTTIVFLNTSTQQLQVMGKDKCTF
ncbi:polymeric immunoglobulin receptor [Engraulis encrasicolus]|uniref:polymeric immunoglobulin receptor n=1 Tax=Engraulis encrasicolus TaxID=184585 RepID=UPI002FD6E912